MARIVKVDLKSELFSYSIDEQAKARAAYVRKGPLRFELFEVAGAAPLPAERRTPPSGAWR